MGQSCCNKQNIDTNVQVTEWGLLVEKIPFCENLDEFLSSSQNSQEALIKSQQNIYTFQMQHQTQSSQSIPHNFGDKYQLSDSIDGELSPSFKDKKNVQIE